MTIWRWTMSGTEPDTGGTVVRGADASGELDADCAGEVVEHLVRRGPWDEFDQSERVTITVEPAGRERP